MRFSGFNDVSPFDEIETQDPFQLEEVYFSKEFSLRQDYDFETASGRSSVPDDQTSTSTQLTTYQNWSEPSILNFGTDDDSKMSIEEFSTEASDAEPARFSDPVSLEVSPDEVVELVSKYIHQESITSEEWGRLDTRGKGLIIAWLNLESSQKSNPELKKVEETDLELANRLLQKRRPKRSDQYKRTFYKSFIQYLLGKNTGYKNDKNHQISPYLEKMAKQYFPENKQLRELLTKSQHLSLNKLKALLTNSGELRAEFKKYMSAQLPLEIKAKVQVFSTIIYSGLSSLQSSSQNVPGDVLNTIVVKVVSERSLVPWTLFDVKEAQKIFAQMIGKFTGEI